MKVGDNMSSVKQQKTTACVATIFAMAFFVGAGLSSQVFAAKSDYQASKKMRIPKNNQLTPERIELGKALFFDPRLSDTNQMSCATCHNPSLYWTDGLKKAVGNKSQQLKRATPTIVNIGHSRRLFWDGRARSLEEQASGPIKSSIEMNQDIQVLIGELKAIPGYVELFDKAYPGEGITEKTIGKGLASFQRTIVSAFNSPFDRWLAGDKDSLSAAAKRGFELFDGKARCNICHEGKNFTDGSFHNIGLNNGDDVGRYEFVKVNVMKGAFKTPTLREIARTAPYMHNGEYQTLEEVIEHYVKGGVNKSNLSPEMKAVKLTQREKTDLLEFLKSLTEQSNPITVPNLPN